MAMEPSYRDIDYRLRPAKNIERKMMCECFRRLAPFGRLDSYQYVGLGSIYFADFILFHKTLGIRSMTSIEGHEEDEARIRFNRPFHCITILMGDSNHVLPNIGLRNSKAIVWLDYDYELCTSVFSDVERVCMEACPGSVMLVTVDTETKRLENPRSFEKEACEIEWPDDPLEQLKRLVGDRRVPATVGKEDLKGVGLRRVYHGMLRNAVDDALSARNAACDGARRVTAKQIMYFQYADGAEMMTTGWLILQEDQLDLLEKCALDQLDFLRTGEEPFRIGSPRLTWREMRYLDTRLPVAPGATLAGDGIPADDLKAYISTYRWFPTFAETEL